MIIHKTNRFVGYLKLPEVQFFFIFTIPFIGFFLVNYLNIPEIFKFAGIVAGASAFLLVLFQTIYTASAHRRMKQEENSFISVTAHQMRTPLTAVRWVLEELSKKDVQEKDRDELVRVAGIATQKLGNIVDAFSEIARIEDGQLDFRFETMELIDFVDRMVTEAEPVAKQYGIALHFERPQEGLLILGDPIKLEMVMSNLINNAIKYNRHGGTVVVRIRGLNGERMAEVSVEDTGIGIGPAEKSHIFEKYYRTDEAKRLNTSGTGLGLYLVKQVVLQHGGRVWLDSIQGKGTTFHFVLPTRSK